MHAKSLIERERSIWNAAAEKQLRTVGKLPHPTFDSWLQNKAHYALFEDFLRSHPMKEASVLQLGAGDPFFLHFSDIGFRTFIVADLADKALDLARARAEANPRHVHVRYVASDAHRLPIEDESVGLIVANSVVHHLRRDEAIREFHRILKPGGRALFLDYYLNGPIRLLLFTRYLRRKDRGTDNPLSQRDIRMIKRSFKTRVHYYGFLSNILMKFLPKQRGRSVLIARQNKLLRADLVMEKLPLYGRFLSTTALLMLEKAR